MRFFDREQRQQHAEEIGGWHCEMLQEDQSQCEHLPLEAAHMDAWSNGGETVEDNLLLLCLPHHYIQHLIQDERGSALAIHGRMSDDDINYLKELGYGD